MKSVNLKKENAILEVKNFMKIIFFSLVFVSSLCAAENIHNGFYSSLSPDMNSRNLLTECQNICMQSSKDIHIAPIKDHHSTICDIVLPNMGPSDLIGKVRRINGEKMHVYDLNTPAYDMLKKHPQTLYLQENLNKYVSHFTIKDVSNFNGFLVLEIKPIFNATAKRTNRDFILNYLENKPHISLFKMGAGRSGKYNSLSQKEQDQFMSPLKAKFNRGEFDDVKIKFDKINFSVEKDSRGMVPLGK